MRLWGEEGEEDVIVQYPTRDSLIVKATMDWLTSKISNTNLAIIDCSIAPSNIKVVAVRVEFRDCVADLFFYPNGIRASGLSAEYASPDFFKDLRSLIWKAYWNRVYSSGTGLVINER